MEDVMANRIEENFEGDVSREIVRQTGVTIRYRFGVGDASEQVTLMIADRSYPDFVHSRSMQGSFMDAGAYLDISGLIDEHGPNIRAHFGDAYRHLIQDDGSVRFVGARTSADIPADPESGFVLQIAVLRELGWPTIRTVYDFSDAIREYYARYPEINGMPTIPYTLNCSQGWRHFITLINPAMRAAGFPDDGNYYVNPSTYEVQYAYTLPELKEYNRWLNMLWNEGLLDPDAFTQEHDEYITKIAQGRVLGLSDSYWQYSEGQGVLDADGNFERTYMMFPASLSPTILNPTMRLNAYTPQNGVAVTDNNSNPVRAVQFLDWMCMEESQILMAWGIEGQHWEIRDGKRRMTAAELEGVRTGGDVYARSTAIGMHNYPFPVVGDKLDRNGYQMNRRVDGDVIASSYNPSLLEAVAAYGISAQRELYPGPNDLIPSEWGQAWQTWDIMPRDEPFGMLHAEMNTLVNEHLTRAIMASAADFDRMYDDFVQRLFDAGADELGRLATDIIKGLVG
jgi:putative aldouronate transport system substrate-binding protein